MKKFFAVSAVLLFVALSTNAQIFTIGPKFGISNTNLSIEENINQYESGDARYSFHGGLFARVKITGFYIQPEIYFNSVRGEYVDPALGTDQEVEFNQNKIDVPVLFGWKFGPLRVNAGPVASFNMNSLEDIEDPAVQDYNRAVFAYQAGIGFDISKLIVDLRYEGNISNQAVLGEEGNVKVNQIMLSLGYKLL